MAGKKRKPAAIHAITGRKPGHDSAGRPINTNFPTSGIGLDSNSPPTLIADNEIAVAEWNRVLKILDKIPGWVEESDMSAVLAYCVAFVNFYNVSQKVMRTRKGADSDELKRDTVSLNTANRTLFQAMSALGFTPADRAKIVIDGTKAKNAVDDFKNKFMK